MRGIFFLLLNFLCAKVFNLELEFFEMTFWVLFFKAEMSSSKLFEWECVGIKHV